MNHDGYRHDKAVAVYCGSSDGVDARFVDAAYELGRDAARRGWATVTGAGPRGLMGAVVRGTLDGGGKAIGVIPQFMVDRGWASTDVSVRHITDGMHSRKKMMAELSDGAIALPGGVGTFDELMEIITWRQLGLYEHPVVLVNTSGYYDGLLAMLEHAGECGMLRVTDVTGPLWHVVETPGEALDIIERAS